MEGNVETNQTLNNLKGTVVAVPKIDAGLTKEGYAADAKATGDSLDARVKKTDIVANLTSDEDDKPLAASMGKELAEQIEDMKTSESSSVDYDNSDSGLGATSVQGAIDEVADIANNAVQKLNGNVNGELTFGKGSTAIKYGGIKKDSTSTSDNGMRIRDIDENSNEAILRVRASDGELEFYATGKATSKVLHEANKPFNNYTGNGSAGTRTVNTGAIGRLLMVYSSTRLALVTPKGAFVINTSAGTFEWIDETKAFYLNGALTLETTSQALNASGTTYYYQAI